MKAIGILERSVWRKAGIAALLFYLLKGLCWMAIGFALWRH
jgi:hypothetical protein